jgi:hypothetical protein
MVDYALPWVHKGDIGNWLLYAHTHQMSIDNFGMIHKRCTGARITKQDGKMAITLKVQQHSVLQASGRIQSQNTGQMKVRQWQTWWCPWTQAIKKWKIDVILHKNSSTHALFCLSWLLGYHCIEHLYGLITIVVPNFGACATIFQ